MSSSSSLFESEDREVVFTTITPNLATATTTFTPAKSSITTTASSIGAFVSVNTDDLEKRGRLGKFFARRPQLARALLLICALLGVCAAVYMIARLAWNSVYVVAAGHAPVSLFGSVVSKYPSVKINGRLVENVVNPLDSIRSLAHAVLVTSELQRHYVNRSSVTAEQVARGYLPWRVVKDEPLRNFTLSGAHELARRIGNETGAACVCYLFLGVAENIVYLTQSNEVLYEPTIERDDEASAYIKFTVSSEAMTLLRGAWRGMSGVVSDEVTAAIMRDEHLSHSRGIVKYIAAGGVRRDRALSGHDFPCIKVCTMYFPLKK
jgi:hypothetical protein